MHCLSLLCIFLLGHNLCISKRISIKQKAKKKSTKILQRFLKNGNGSYNTSENIDNTSNTMVSKKRKIQSCDEHPIIDSNHTQWDMSDACITDNIDSSGEKDIEQKNTQLLQNYMKHQSVMNMDSKTKAAVKDKEKSKALTTRTSKCLEF